MKKFFQSFLKDETGASAAEYALILAVVGTAIVVGAISLSDSISGSMCKTANIISTGEDSTDTTCPAADAG